MVTTVSTRQTAASYWSIIKHLSPDAKLDLITMLTKSLKENAPKRVSAKKYYGIYNMTRVPCHLPVTPENDSIQLKRKCNQ